MPDARPEDIFNQFRLRGKGDESPAGAPPGSLTVTLRVRPHPALRRREADILVDLPIDRALARRGGEAEAPTLAGDRSGSGASPSAQRLRSRCSWRCSLIADRALGNP